MPRWLVLTTQIVLGVGAAALVIYLARVGWQVSTQLATDGPRRPSGRSDVFIQLAGIVSGALVGIIVAMVLLTLAGAIGRLVSGSRR